MRSLLEFSDADLGDNPGKIDRTGYARREAARAVVTDDEGRVALLHVAKHGYYKLPGGGIDPGESITEALKRELKEEIGCEAEIISELGTVMEHRDARKFTQISYAFTAHQTGEQQAPEMTAKELDDGFEMVWAADLEDAINLVGSAKPRLYEARHIQLRDLAILKSV